MDAASITTCIADRSSGSATRMAPANDLNWPWIRAIPMCRAVKSIEECAGSISQSPGSGSSGGRATWRVTSPSEASEFSATCVVARYGVYPSADTASRYSPAGTVVTNDPNGSVPPLTT